MIKLGLRYYLTMALRGGNRELSSSPQKRNNVSFSYSIDDQVSSALNPVVSLDEDEFGTQSEQPFLYIDDQFRALYTEEEVQDTIATYASVVIGALPELYELDKERTEYIATVHLLSFVSDLCTNLKRYPNLLFNVLFAMFVAASNGDGNSSGLGSPNNTVPSGRRTSMIAVNAENFNRRGSLIISNEGGTSSTMSTAGIGSDCSTYFSHANMLVFLKLVATLQPRSLYGVLMSTDNYSLDDAILVCRERRVFDASSYLLERVGDISGALDVALNEFTNCCTQLSDDVAVLMVRNVSRIVGSSGTVSSPADLLQFKKSMNTALRAIESDDMNFSFGNQGTLIFGNQVEAG